MTFVAGTIYAPALLRVDSGAVEADAIVVLGGEPQRRPDYAAKVYQRVPVAHVIASGNGDCEDTRRLLAARGVPEGVIRLECESTNTKENAQFTIAMLRERKAGRVIVVTSWFHSRRALACFRHYGPEITFYSCPTPVDEKRLWPNQYQRGRIRQEYAKLLGYWVRYGVKPF